jgi:predicted DNA-binding transcriptional regulator AlpA
MSKHGALPANLSPRGICREAAAEYIGISPGTFDEMVRDGRMPGPKRINSRKVWDVRALDTAFTALPADGEANPWDEVITR